MLITDMPVDAPLSPFDEFFRDLGEGYRITDLQIFKSLVREATLEPESLQKLVHHFWQASRSASLNYSINIFSSYDTTKPANKYMGRKMQAVYALFASNVDTSTATDLEKLMGMHVRLQTVPHPDFMQAWLKEAGSRMDEFTPEWHRVALENFTRLGVYPGDEWIENWWVNAPQDLESPQPADLYRILYRMATLDFLRRDDESLKGTPSPCRKIAKTIFDFIEPSADTLFPQFINNQVFFAGLWFGRDFVTKFKVTGDDKFNPSSFETKVMRHIRENSKVMVSASGIIVPYTGHKIDLRLEAHGQVFGCEVDGISHFNRIAGATPHETGVVYNASTRFHSALIAHYLHDRSVLRIPYFKFDGTQEGIPWEKTLGKIARKGDIGVFAWHGGSDSKDLERRKNAHIFMGCDL